MSTNETYEQATRPEKANKFLPKLGFTRKHKQAEQTRTPRPPQNSCIKALVDISSMGICKGDTVTIRSADAAKLEDRGLAKIVKAKG